MRKTPEVEIKKRNLTLMGQLSVSDYANQPPGFFVSGKLTPNGLFQTMNELKRLVSYSKQLH